MSEVATGPVESVGDTGQTRSGRPLRIVITNPFVWPYVRRGSERLLNDLAGFLHCCGHDVTVLAMAPAGGHEVRDGVHYRLVRQRFNFSRRQFNSCHYFAVRLQRVLRNCDADVVFCLNYFDAYAALRARRHAPHPYRVIFQAVGIPVSRFFRAVPLDALFMRTVLREADRSVVLSRFAHDTLLRDFGSESEVLPPPVMVERFGGGNFDAAGNDSLERVLFVGDATEPRKGIHALCRAFAQVKRQRPLAQLVISGRITDEVRQQLLADPDVAEITESLLFAGVGRVEELPDLYRQAAVTVLPAVWEAFGLVLVESLAAGTPVVGCRHGGIPDIITDVRVGRLVEPGDVSEQMNNVDQLAGAVIEILEQGKTPEVRTACREIAANFSWAELGPRYERLIRAVVGGQATAR